jgi:cbb3-type cytochrome oxidase maturation protein
MEVLFILIGFSLLVAVFFLGCFFWAVQSGQYEDRYTPALRILLEERQSKSFSSEQKLEE